MFTICFGAERQLQFKSTKNCMTFDFYLFLLHCCSSVPMQFFLFKVDCISQLEGALLLNIDKLVIRPFGVTGVAGTAPRYHTPTVTHRQPSKRLSLALFNDKTI